MQIRAGVLSMVEAAVLLGITVDEVRERVQQAGWTAQRLPDGDDGLSLDDLHASIREEGRHRQR